MQVVVVPRNPLPVLAKLPAPLEPAAQAMSNDDLVPKGPLGMDRRDIWHSEIQCFEINVDLGSDRDWSVRIEGGFRA